MDAKSRIILVEPEPHHNAAPALSTPSVQNKKIGNKKETMTVTIYQFVVNILACFTYFTKFLKSWPFSPNDAGMRVKIYRFLPKKHTSKSCETILLIYT
jgi:hypothetical protein